MHTIVKDYKNSGFLHHAYCLEGERQDVLSIVLSFVENSLKMRVIGNPDVLVLERELFSIDDARSVAESATRKSFTQGQKIVIIFAENYNEHSQNALLKTLEEPIPNSHFFILAPSLKMFLPTFLSRVFSIEKVLEKANIKVEESESFLKASLKDRLSIVGKMADDLSKDKIERSDIRRFLDGMERKLYKDHLKISQILKAKRLVSFPGSSVKMILENIAINI